MIVLITMILDRALTTPLGTQVKFESKSSLILFSSFVIQKFFLVLRSSVSVILLSLTV